MKSLFTALNISVIVLLSFFSSALSAAEFPAGYSLTFIRNTGSAVSTVRADTFAEFFAILEAGYEATIPKDAKCIGRGGMHWTVPISVKVGKGSLEGHESEVVWIKHTREVYYCSRGEVLDSTGYSYGPLNRYCPAGFDRIRKQRPDGLEDTFCVGPDLLMEADNSVYPPDITASLGDAGSDTRQVTFSIIDFELLDGSSVPREAWGNIASSCSIIPSEQGDGSCTVTYKPQTAGVAIIEGKTQIASTTITETVEVEVTAPDLSMEMESEEQSPVTLYPGQALPLDLTISNPSVVNFDDDIDTVIFLSKDEQLSDDDTIVGRLPSVSTLNAGSAIEKEVEATTPEEVVSGSYKLLAVANPAAVYAHQRGETPDPIEQRYDNNISVLSVDIETPKIEIEICVGNPISTNSGRKIETEVDYEGTGPFPLRFARHYNSRPGNNDGWSTSYSRRLLVIDRNDGTTDVIVERDDAMRLEFEDIDAQGYSDPDVPGFMSRTDDGFAYLDPQGNVHEFSADGRLTRIISQRGFVQNLTYENDELVAVTDDFGRELSFEYSDGRLISMTAPNDQTWLYAYDEDGLLTSVTLPDDTPVTETDNPTRTYLYESPHVAHGLTGIIDENGKRFSTFEYDEEGRATLTTHAGGAGSNMITYGDNETTVTGPLGKNTTYVFDEILGTNRLVRVDGHPTVDCPATQSTREYDARGSVTREIDASGNVTEYTYTHTDLPDDEYLYHVGLVTRVTEAAGTAEARTTEIRWHPEFRLPNEIVEPGRTTTLTYDDHARLLRRAITAHDTGVDQAWTYTYDDDGLLTRIDGPRTDLDDTTHLAYDNFGNVVSVTNAAGHVTEILDHSADGMPLVIRDPNGLRTQLEYDARNRLETMSVQSDAGIASTHVDYDAKGNVVAITLPDGQTLHYTYDAADRLIGIENDLGETIEFTRDADGNRTAEVTRAADNSIVRVQKRAFDELSRVIETIGAANQTTEIGYDLNGNLDFIEDALGRQSSMAFDGLDRLISITDALGGESTFTYDDRDNLTSVTDAEGVTTTYDYDGHDNLTREVSTASGTTHHRYDAAGNRIGTTDANGITTEYRYDALNRLTAIEYPSAPQENITYTYDGGEHALGRLTAIDDPSSETTFGYDDRGNLVRDQRIIDAVSYTTRYEYNLAGQMTAMVYPSGRIVRYQLDALSRVERITTQATAASPVKVVAEDIDYLPYGPASTWTHGNGLETDIHYDRDYRITDIDVADLDAIMSLTYQYNDVSNITGMLDNLGINSQSFGYDELNRLTEAEGNYGEIDYTYDGVGNRTSRTIATDDAVEKESYTYETGSHRLQSVTTTEGSETTTRQFSHDANGNTVSDVSSQRALELSVNARNRLAAIDKDGRRVGEYTYNALGQRVAKTSRYRGRLHAHFDNSNLVPSEAEGPRASQNHVVLNDSEGPHNGKSKNSNNNRGSKGQNTVVLSDSEGPHTSNKSISPDGLHTHYDNKPVTERLHFHYDRRGNLIAESDDNGNVVREYLYLGQYRIAMTTVSLDKPTLVPSEAEGPQRQKLALYYIHNDHLGTAMKVTDSEQRVVWSMEQKPFGEAALTTEGIRMPMRFPGQYADIESGFSYNYFRDYDPSLGRYIQSDPIGVIGGLNQFEYAESTPASTIDRRGLFGIVGASIGFVSGATSAFQSAISSGKSVEEAAVFAGGFGVIGAIVGGFTGPVGIKHAAALGAAVSGSTHLVTSISLTGTVTPISQIKATLLGAANAIVANATAFRASLLAVRASGNTQSAIAIGASLGGTIDALLRSVESNAQRFISMLTNNTCHD